LFDARLIIDEPNQATIQFAAAKNAGPCRGRRLRNEANRELADPHTW